MNKLLKIFCFYGLFCLCYCCKNSINPNLINKKVCKQILVKIILMIMNTLLMMIFQSKNCMNSYRMQLYVT